YGLSTTRIIAIFFGLALAFAAVYYCGGAFDYYILGNKSHPGFVDNLFVDENTPVLWWQVPLRSVYFSIVTMTTLGFGDMHANPHGTLVIPIGSYILLMVQVILGYVLLGTLVTRFAVMFTAGGPAGHFTPMDKKTEELLRQIRKIRLLYYYEKRIRPWCELSKDIETGKYEHE
ncbi:MAG: ion channel, partial [Planctomycetota bacterium]|nr:ion channel [Planctomycetota bacterium]